MSQVGPVECLVKVIDSITKHTIDKWAEWLIHRSINETISNKLPTDTKQTVNATIETTRHVTVS